MSAIPSFYIHNLFNDILTSTPGSMEMEVICLTISEGECKSIKRLWILISNLSKVSEPLPQGDLRVVMRRTLVGRRTGPLTLSCLSLARWMRSAETIVSRYMVNTKSGDRDTHTHTHTRFLKPWQP